MKSTASLYVIYLFSRSYCFVSFLLDSLLNSTSPGKRYFRLGSRSNNENILKPCREDVSLRVFNGNNVERSLVFFNVLKLSNTALRVTTSDHNERSKFELDHLGHLARANVYLDCVVGLEVRIRITDGPSVVSDSNRNLVGRYKDLLYSAELEFGLLLVHADQSEAALDIVQQAESIATFFQFDHVHKSGRIVGVCANLAIDLDAPFHGDLHAFLIGQGVLEPISKDYANGQTLALFVRTGTGLRSPDTTHFTQIPVFRGIKPLQMLLWSSDAHCCWLDG
mmetsp:Transcript_24580/g.35245  ORF Transcript_24580/g.35245 Transcript_24580/m.35245 type:complete len:280 (-) Transcript_24580:58-897(-)